MHLDGFAKQFIGLNPRKDYDAGFFFRRDGFIDETFGTAPSSIDGGSHSDRPLHVRLLGERG